jgi:transketolase
MSAAELDQQAVNTLRFLAIDAIEQAQSGHPGLPLGAAPTAYTLYDRVMRFNPADPDWFNRDRFVLSAGHGSSLLYALLHVFGYDLPLDEIKNFRQWGSLTPGHPEYGETPGVETTTGPLGQGFATAAGMAMAEHFLAARYNRPDFPLIDHHTYVLCGDGDLMEGISYEAASLAGHLGLGKLIVLYDDNSISLEGDLDLAFSEDIDLRFEACAWQVLHVADANDLDTVEAALAVAIGDPRPSLIRVKSHIGYGSFKQDHHTAHGEALGDPGVQDTKEKLGWPVEPPFHVPGDVIAHCREAGARGAAAQSAWEALFAGYRAAHPAAAAELETAISGELPGDWDADFPAFSSDAEVSLRDASGATANALAAHHPTFFGGSADVAPSTRTYLNDKADFIIGADDGPNVRFGVREHAMGAMCNGASLHGGILPFAGTFLIFADYIKPAMRLSALMGQKVIYVFTHDSIAQGEDGPTHQAIEQLATLRATPGLEVYRPADANETVACWRTFLQRPGPVAIALGKWDIPVFSLDDYPIAEGAPRGGYVLAGDSDPEVVLIATGAEVHHAVGARDLLAEQGVNASVVSLPCWEVFDEQDQAYRDSVLPPGVPKVGIEAAASLGWHKYVGTDGALITLDRFGASAPMPVVLEKLGYSPANVAATALKLLGR